MRVVPKIAGLDPLGGGLPLFTSCLEEAFSEIGLPVLSILGISVNKGTLPSSFRSLGAGFLSLLTSLLFAVIVKEKLIQRGGQ